MSTLRSLRGYTLIEMVITITILMVFVGIVSGSYTNLVRANRNANDNQKVYHAMRLIFDTLADEIRRSRIDYSCIDINPLSPDALCSSNAGFSSQQIIALLNDTGTTRTMLRFNDGALELARYARLSVDNIGWTAVVEWQPLNPKELPIEDGSFAVFPLKDPYDPDNVELDNVQFQPSIHVQATIQGNHFETTYSSRAYGTRILY